MMARLIATLLLAAALGAAETSPPTSGQAEELNLLSQVLGECDVLSHDLEAVSSQRNSSAFFAALLSAVGLWLLFKRKPQHTDEAFAATGNGPIANITIRDGATQKVQSSSAVQTRRVNKRNTQAYERVGDAAQKRPTDKPPASP